MENSVYISVVTILTFYVISQYQNVYFMNSDNVNTSKLSLGIVVAIFMIVLIGLMPFTGHYTADRWNYVEWYVLGKGKVFNFDWSQSNYLFDNAYEYVRCNNVAPKYFFLPISGIYFGCMLWACKKLFPKDSLLAFVVYLGAFSTYSYGINGAKAGAAASLFLMAVSFRNKKLIAAFFMFLSLGFHHSMIVPIAAFVISYFVKERKYFIYGWVFCFMMAALGVSYFMTLFAGYTDEGGAAYLNISKTEKDVSGFRPDFIIYSAIPIFLGEYFMRKFEIKSEEYEFIWKVYVTANSVFLLCTYGSYINRIAYLSWLLYPIVLIYPFLKADLGDNQYSYLRYAVYGHLGFTLFMSFIYY